MADTDTEVVTPPPSPTERARRVFAGALSGSGPLLGLIVLCTVLAVMAPRFLTVGNLFNVFQQITVLAVLSLGGTAVIITKGIDLSVGSVLGLGAVVAGWTFATAGLPMIVAIFAGIAVGALAGLVNGLLITYGRLPPFVATLAMLSVARGLALVITDGQPITGYPDWFRWIATFRVLGIVPVSVLIVAAMFVLGSLYLRYRPTGRALYAIGGNEEVARLSGINVRRAKIKVYTAAGALAAIGGLFLTARLNSAQPTAGTTLELDVIAAVVIGGASLNGGSGKLTGTLVGALIIGVIRNGLNLLGVSSFWQQIVIGAVIAIAVMTDTLRKPAET
jgi:ribose transport system permease protein